MFYTALQNFFKVYFERNFVGLILVLACVFGNVLKVEGQTTIASESFDNSLTLFTASGAGYAYYSGNSGTGDKPASSPFFTLGNSWGVRSTSSSISSGTLTSNNINTSLYSAVSVSLRLASFSIGSTTNGADVADLVNVSISPDGGTNYYSTIRVLGRANSRWSFSTGTGTALTTYDGNSIPLDFQPATSGGDRTSDGYSTISITDLPSVSNLRIRITLSNDGNNQELWVIDEFKVIGTLINSPNITVAGTLSPLSTCFGSVSSSTSINVSGTNLTADITVNAPTGFEVSLSSATGYSSSVTLTQNNGSISSVPVYFRIATSASVGTLSGNITLTSTGASTVTIAINGTVNALPSAVTVSPATSTIVSPATVNLTASGGTISSAVSTTTIGTNNSSTKIGSNGNPYKCGTTNGSARNQWIILASELTNAGLQAGSQLSSLTFTVLSSSGGIVSNQTFGIAHTSASAFTSTSFLTETFTTVYSNTANYTHTVGANTHNFSTNFIWNGTSNIVIEDCHYIYLSSIDYFSPDLETFTTSFNSTNGLSITGTLVSTCTSPTGATLARRPVIKFNIGPVISPTWTWSPNTSDNTSVVTVGPSSTTTYYATATINGCSTTSSAVVNVNSNTPSCPNASSIAPSSTQTICQNATASQLTASYTSIGTTGTPTVQYQWYYNTTNSNTVLGATLIAGQTSSTFTPPSTTIGTRYYFCVVYATNNGCGQTYATQSLASNAVTVTVNELITWANTQSPTSGSICVGGVYSVYGKGYIPNVTSIPGAQSGMVAELGYSTSNSVPSGAGWTWLPLPASYNVQSGNDDEYMATLSELTAGTYYYTYRYTYNGCGPVYGGINGVWSSTSDNGILTVYNNPTVTMTPSTICNGATNVAVSATGASTYELLLNGVSQGYASSTANWTVPGPLSTGATVCVRGYDANNLAMNGNITESFWGHPISTSAGGPVSGFGTNRLNALYVRNGFGYLNLAVAGSLQNDNKIFVFLDTKSGGYNNLSSWTNRSNAPSYAMRNFNGLNGGIQFDAGFEPDYIVSIGVDNLNVSYLDFYDMQNNVNTVIGNPSSAPTLFAYNSNASATDYTNGYEIRIPNSLIGTITLSPIKLFGMLTNNPASNAATFLSNQFLSPAGSGQLNFAAGVVNFNNEPPNPISYTLNSDCYTDVCRTVTAYSTPTFTQVAAICSGASLSALPTTSTNSVTGTWSPAINNSATTTYTFTPTAGQCANTATMDITVNPGPAITNMTTTICSGETFTVTPVNGTNGTVPSLTTYTWSAPSVVGITGTTAGTSASSISGTLTNTTNAVINVVYNVTPTTGTCVGGTFTVTVTVDPPLNYGTAAAVVTSGNTVNHLVISQIYGGGSATYPNDYVELYNPTSGTLPLTGLTIQYQTAGNATTWSIYATLSGSIPSGKYFLIHMTTNAGSTATPVTADQTTSNNINANDGKIALVNSTSVLPSSSASCTSALIIDKVGFGSHSQPCFETQIAPTPSSNAIYRDNLCAIDTDNNYADFALLNPPAPRNSASPENLCAVAAPTSFCGSGTPGAMSVTGVSGGTSYTYQWYSQAGSITCPTGSSTAGWTSLGATNGANTATYTPASAISATTTYACMVTINGSSCGSSQWSTSCITITINPNPSIADKTAVICSGNTYTLVASLGDVIPSGTTYTWTFTDNTNVTGESNGTAQSPFSQTISSSSTATESVVYNVNSTNGTCTGNPFSVTLTIPKNPSVIFLSPP